MKQTEGRHTKKEAWRFLLPHWVLRSQLSFSLVHDVTTADTWASCPVASLCRETHRSLGLEEDSQLTGCQAGGQRLCHSLACMLGILLQTLRKTGRVGMSEASNSARSALSLPCPPTASTNDVISASCVFMPSCIPPVQFATSLSTCTDPPSDITQPPELPNPSHNSTCRL